MEANPDGGPVFAKQPNGRLADRNGSAAQLVELVAAAGERYAADVKARRFPGPEHVVTGQPKAAAKASKKR